MYDCYLTYRSITHAQRAAMVLQRAGIRCRFARTPKAISGRGCGYSILVRVGDCDRAAAMLRAAGADFSAAYRGHPETGMEVIAL